MLPFSKRHFLKISTLLSIIFSPYTYALQDRHELIILNHFDSDLTFNIGINPDVLPDWKETFKLATNQETKSIVLDVGKEAYIHVEDNGDHSAFWGVEVLNSKVTIHGYLSKDIAYSWSDHTIIFCTPLVYKRKGYC